MTDTEADRLRWQEWAAHACAAVGVDPAAVDIASLHHLSTQVARRLERPLVPLSTFILGLAVGAAQARGEAGEGTRAAALACILDTLPEQPSPPQPRSE